MEGEDGETAADSKKDSEKIEVTEKVETDTSAAFYKKPVWQRILVVVAGAVTNIVTGFILVIILTMMSQAIATNVIAKFDAQSTSNAAGGLCVGDKIYAINGARVHVSSDIMYDLILDSDGVVNMQVIRGGKLITLDSVHFPMVSDGNGGKIMRRDFWVKGEKKTFFNVVHESFFQTISMVRLVWMTFLQLFTGRFGLKDLAGPIGTTAAVGQAAAAGLPDLLYVAALIVVNLGVVNLFPLPALDGGRLLFLLLEAIRRKPINPKYEGYVNFAGFALLMLLMVVVSFNDIMRLIKG